jgi:tetratricopeptide (TPR) repeat protein
MSNSFPKVSPDGRWIVFVRGRNGMVMRPDGKLYIVPFEGGEARLMKCNTPLMNSWHTFSPNGRWLAFSSKSRSPYTQLYLTHIDANGNDTPPILVDNTTAANRAVNLPEFANIPRGGLEKIDPVATEFYRMENTALDLMTKNQFGEAIPVWRKALEMDPGDGRAHFNLGYSLSQTGDLRDALAEYGKACDLSPDDPVVFADFALALAQDGQPDEAIANYRKSLALDASNPKVQADLGTMLYEKGLIAEGLEHLEKAIALNPDSADAHNKIAAVAGEDWTDRQSNRTSGEGRSAGPGFGGVSLQLRLRAGAGRALRRRDSATAEGRRAERRQGLAMLRHAGRRLQQDGPAGRCHPSLAPGAGPGGRGAQRGTGPDLARQAGRV